MHNSEDFSYVQAPQKTLNEKRSSNPSDSAGGKQAHLRNLKLLSTKELAQKTSLSSRKVNSSFVDNQIMYKKDDDWHATKKGSELGAKQLEGANGKFLIWSEELSNEIKE